MTFEVTAEMLDKGAFGGALLISVIASVWRVYFCNNAFQLDRFMTDIFNSAAVVPLLALMAGLFNDEIWSAATQSNRVLVTLACFVALLSVLRAVFRAKKVDQPSRWN